MAPPPINLDKPMYDQTTYEGRAKHFLRVTNPLNLLASSAQLDEAKRVVQEFKKTNKMPEGYDETKLWSAKYLYDSAHHPDTGERLILIGRMSAQAPMNTLITGGMITFYKTTPATVFWQWINQTFNAVVNYSNRSGDATISTSKLLMSYCAACGGALGTALYLNSKVKYVNPVFARLVPFAAVCGANFVNIPFMRSNELINGTPVFTDKGDRIGNSTRAAATGIFLVCLSRVLMATPGMILTPLLTNYGEKRGWFVRRRWAIMPFQTSLVAVCVTIATPLCCALFPQQFALPAASLEGNIKEEADKKKASLVYFNKGL